MRIHLSGPLHLHFISSVKASCTEQCILRPRVCWCGKGVIPSTLAQRRGTRPCRRAVYLTHPTTAFSLHVLLQLSQHQFRTSFRRSTKLFADFNVSLSYVYIFEVRISTKSSYLSSPDTLSIRTLIASFENCILGPQLQNFLLVKLVSDYTTCLLFNQLD